MAKRKHPYTRKETIKGMRETGATKKSVASGGSFVTRSAGGRTTGPKNRKNKK